MQTGGISSALGEVNFASWTAGQEQPRSYIRIACEVASLWGSPTGVRPEQDAGHEGTVCVGGDEGWPSPTLGGRQSTVTDLGWPFTPGQGQALSSSTTVLEVAKLEANTTSVPLGFLRAQAVVSFRAGLGQG